METQTASTASLIPYERNNRQHSQQQVDRIANSIAEFGFNQPIVVDENNIVLVGHGRLDAAKKLGLAEVPIVRKAGLTETQKKAYRILDNKLQNDSTWDAESLNLELAALEDADFDLAAWGLDEFAKLFPEDKTVEEDDFEPREVKETIIKPGDLLELGEHRLMCGDSTKAEDVERLMEGKKADLWITDPPYGVGYQSRGRRGTENQHAPIENDNRPLDEMALLWEQAASNAFSLSTDAASYYWFACQGGDQMMMMMSISRARWKVRHELVWSKDQLVFGRCDYHYKHEPILYGWKQGGTHKWMSDRSQVSVLEFARPKRSDDHPTMKPISLVAYLMGNNSSPGEIVLDTFLGSGTTLIAADQLGRKCYGMEISPQYCQVIVDRYKAHCEKSGKPFECRLNGDDVSGYISKPDHVAGTAIA